MNLSISRKLSALSLVGAVALALIVCLGPVRAQESVSAPAAASAETSQAPQAGPAESEAAEEIAQNQTPEPAPAPQPKPAAGENSSPTSYWKLDRQASRVGFVASSMLTGDLDGVFHKWAFSGNIPRDLEGAQGRLTVEVASIDTNNRRRDDHLRNEDFFHVEKHPTAVFHLEKADRTASDIVVAMGNLTIKETTKRVTVPFQISESGNRMTMQGRILIKRSAYGVDYDSVMNPIEEDVVLDIKLVFTK